ncbi:MAG: thioredoxin family protein [Rhodospirillales bacterium]
MQRLTRRGFAALAATTAAAAVLARPALAASTPFTADAFRAAQAEGRTLIVEVWASWCPTCRAQTPIVESLVAEPKFAGARVLRINYDVQRDAMRELNARSHATLIVFKGTEERGRATGITAPQDIRTLLEKGL